MNKPITSRSSLSHSMTVRSSIAAFSIGTISHKRPLGDHHPADVLAEVAREAEQFGGERDEMMDAVILRIDAGFAQLRRGERAAMPPVELAGQFVEHVLAEPQHLADIAHGRASAIGDERPGHPGAVAAVFLVDILDDLLAALVFEIDVDVRRLSALAAGETLEDECELVRIDRGHPQAITDRGVGRRASALAEDVFRSGVMNQIVNRQKIRLVLRVTDEIQLFFQRVPHLLRNALRISLRRAVVGDFAQIIGWRSPRWDDFGGIVVLEFVQLEAASRGDLKTALDRARIVLEQSLHLPRRFEMPLGVGEKFVSRLLNRAAVAHAGQDILQCAACLGS